VSWEESKSELFPRRTLLTMVHSVYVIDHQRVLLNKANIANGKVDAPAPACFCMQIAPSNNARSFRDGVKNCKVSSGN
jgi:hypothetical protein